MKRLKTRKFLSNWGQAIVCSVIFFGMLATSSLTGCKASLQPGGSYSPVDTNGVATQKPDLAFYEVDSSYNLLYAAVDAAFTFERDNRLWLFKLSPQIKHTLDSIRPQAVSANARYLRTRTAYKANPTPADLSTLGTILAEIQQVSAAATAAISTNNLPKGL